MSFLIKKKQTNKKKETKFRRGELAFAGSTFVNKCLSGLPMCSIELPIINDCLPYLQPILISGPNRVRYLYTIGKTDPLPNAPTPRCTVTKLTNIFNR